MKAIKVEYTVREDYVEKNKENIRNVMKELKSIDNKVRYFVSIKNDGVSFIHIALFQEDKDNIISDLNSFKKFREELKTGLITPPVNEELELVDSSFDFFKAVEE